MKVCSFRTDSPISQWPAADGTFMLGFSCTFCGRRDYTGNNHVLYGAECYFTKAYHCPIRLISTGGKYSEVDVVWGLIRISWAQKRQISSFETDSAPALWWANFTCVLCPTHKAQAWLSQVVKSNGVPLCCQSNIKFRMKTMTHFDSPL